MIPSLPDLVATSTAPKSAIAPPERIGKATFPALLGGLQSSGAKPVETGAGPAAETKVEINLRPHAAPDLFTALDALLKASTVASTGALTGTPTGKALPQNGTDLPSGVQVQEAVRLLARERTLAPDVPRLANQNQSGRTVQQEAIVSKLPIAPVDTPAALPKDLGIAARGLILAPEKPEATDQPSLLVSVSDRSLQRPETERAQVETEMLAQTQPTDIPLTPANFAQGSELMLSTARTTAEIPILADTPAPAKPPVSADAIVALQVSDTRQAEIELPQTRNTRTTTPSPETSDAARTSQVKVAQPSQENKEANGNPPTAAPLAQAEEAERGDISRSPSVARPLENALRAPEAEGKQTAFAADPPKSPSIGNKAEARTRTQEAPLTEPARRPEAKLEPAKGEKPAPNPQLAPDLPAKQAPPVAETQAPVAPVETPAVAAQTIAASLKLARPPMIEAGKAVPETAKTNTDAVLRAPKNSTRQVPVNAPIQLTPASQITLPPLTEIQADTDPSRAAPQVNNSGSSGPTPALPQLAQPPLENSPPQQAAAQSQNPLSPLTAQTAAPSPPADTSAAFRLSPQLESTIEQLAQTRSDAQASKPEVTVRHQEFGAITMRLDASGNDLRATLSARDPGFVPAIQTALAERSIAGSSETSSSANQRGNEQAGSQSSSQSNSQSNAFAGSQSGGQGAQFGAHYGSSTGGGQGTSQPYAGQTGTQDEDAASNRANLAGPGGGSGADGERFA